MLLRPVKRKPARSELVGQLRSWERAQGFTAVVIL
jgi:hypothetical protein